MSIGLGIAIAGVWMMPVAGLMSRHVTTDGFWYSLMSAFAATVLLLICGG